MVAPEKVFASVMVRKRLPLLLAIFACLFVALSPVAAQQKKRSGSVEGSPLDTIMSTRLWTDVPPPKDFVTKTHPDVGKLDYAPLVGTDPVRPKPREKGEIAALQAELEHDGTLNAQKAHGLRGPARSAPGRRAKRKTESATN